MALDGTIDTLGRDRQYIGYVRHTSHYGGLYLARLAERHTNRTLGEITTHLTAEAARSWLRQEAAAWEDGED